MNIALRVIFRRYVRPCRASSLTLSCDVRPLSCQVAVGDMNMRTLQRGDVLQLERRGYFIVDEPLVRAGKPLFSRALQHPRRTCRQEVKSFFPCGPQDEARINILGGAW